MNPLQFFAALLIVLFLPGAAWQAFFRPDRLDPFEKLAEIAGSSLALTGLAALYMFLLGVRLDAGGLAGLYGALLALGALAAWHWNWRPRLTGWGLLAGGAFLGLAAWRLYQARDLALPSWVDSVHHTLLVRRFVEYGGMAPDWLPYLPVPMYYHYGFHILAASFTAWSSFEPAQAVLVLGQVLNACVAFSVYRLGKVLSGRRLVAALAAGFTAVGFHMPAYYLTWGRYPLLAGLVVLPLAMAAALEVQREPRRREAWARLILYSAAVCFCHFLAVGLLGLFLLVLLAEQAIGWLRHRALRQVNWQPFAAAGLGGLAALPWLWRVWSYTQSMFSVDIANPLDPAVTSAGAWEYLVSLTGPYRSHVLIALAAAGLVVTLVWSGGMRRAALWGLLVAFLATPLGPRFNPFRPDHLAIVLFLPGSLTLANLLVQFGAQVEGLAAWAWASWKQRTAPLLSAQPDADSTVAVDVGESESAEPAGALQASDASVPQLPGAWQLGLSLALPALIGLGLAAWGIWDTRDIVNSVTVIANAADVKALRWVAQNTPADARFFINSTVWMGQTYRGEDGGYWLLPYTGRFSVVPPAAYGWGTREDVLQVIEWDRRASEVKSCDEAFWSLAADARLGYAYLREGVGSLQPSALEDCSGAERLYQADGVSIYRLQLNRAAP